MRELLSEKRIFASSASLYFNMVILKYLHKHTKSESRNNFALNGIPSIITFELFKLMKSINKPQFSSNRGSENNE